MLCLVFWFDVDRNDGAFQIILESGFDPVADFVCCGYIHVAPHNQMKVDECCTPGPTYPEIVRLQRVTAVLLSWPDRYRLCELACGRLL